MLVQLDGTEIAANLEIVNSELRDAYARQMRLRAESAGTSALVLPESLAVDIAGGEWDMLVAAQEKLRASRAASLKATEQRLDEQISQSNTKIADLQIQLTANDDELNLVSAESQGVDGLFGSGLVDLDRKNSIKRDEIRLQGQHAALSLEIAQARSDIVDHDLQRAQTISDFQSSVLTDLQKANQDVAQYLQQKISAEDRLSRLEIRAPVTGVIQESQIQTVGGVVGAGETIMLVVPNDDAVVVNSKVSPLDIDKVVAGQSVAVRFSSFDARTTPELMASVTAISPDLIKDTTSGSSYYEAKISIPKAELAKPPVRSGPWQCPLRRIR